VLIQVELKDDEIGTGYTVEDVVQNVVDVLAMSFTSPKARVYHYRAPGTSAVYSGGWVTPTDL